jgi:hypothetical protein
MFRHVTAVVRSALSALSHDPTPPWLADKAVSVWVYRPDTSKLKDRSQLIPMFVVARAWSVGDRKGIFAVTPHLWRHGDNGSSLSDSNDESTVLWEIENDERFAAHMQSGRLCFVGLLPGHIVNELERVVALDRPYSAQEAAKPVDSHP